MSIGVPIVSSRPHAIVIGAGIVGIASAWQLIRRGYRVCVLERNEDVAMETTFANGGQISPSESAPWSRPSTLWSAMGWMFRSSSPFNLHVAADPQQWRWLWGFLSCCTANANESGLRRLLPLAQHSASEMQHVRDEAEREGWPLKYEASLRGILRICRTRRALEHEWTSSAVLRELGVEFQKLSQDECMKLEPALQYAPENTRGGGLYAPNDESGDAHLFTRALWENAKASGLETRFGAKVESLEPTNGGRVAPRVNGETLECDLMVLAAGCGSRELARDLGFAIPLWPVKGYSLTASIVDESRAPQISIMDKKRRTVFSRLGNRMRAAGLADVARSTHENLDPKRAKLVLEALESLFPDSFDPGSIRFWQGYRPMMYDSLPLIGKAPGFEGLWFNLGHGSLGWSLGMGSASLLAQMICGESPEIDPSHYNPLRHLRRSSL